MFVVFMVVVIFFMIIVFMLIIFFIVVFKIIVQKAVVRHVKTITFVGITKALNTPLNLACSRAILGSHVSSQT